LRKAGPRGVPLLPGPSGEVQGDPATPLRIQTRSNTYLLSTLPAGDRHATQGPHPDRPEILAIAKDVAANPAAYRPVAVTCDP
jgi:hypothetical protein